MRKLSVWMEIEGSPVYIGEITGRDSRDACFSYADAYRAWQGSRPVSLSLPLEERTFSPERTKNYFEGLLPEGFTKKCVAQRLHADEEDYLSILSGLGRECLGALKILEEGADEETPEYRLLSSREVEALAREGASESASIVAKSHLSLTGASGKVGLYYEEVNRQWYLPIGDAPSTHIVKQSHVRLDRIVTNEQLCLLTAKQLGICVPDSFILNLSRDGRKTEEGDVLFASRRFDRIRGASDRRLNGMPVPYRLHQEDFAQALGIASARKYERDDEGYMSKIFQLLRLYSAKPLEDQLRLWDICVFNYLIGNTDNHIKNLSLLYSASLRSIRLAPAYDIVSTAVYDSSTENMAFGIGGERNLYSVSRKSFERAARDAGLGVGIAMKRFDTMVSGFEEAVNQASQSLEAQGFEEAGRIRDAIMERGGIGMCESWQH
ncbi:MAG: type II toxin-antitoxin system HipA family toxin [Lachnospiraceae bacterium]|nr:type II toxin-antitoxin system HipA family toxin [Lachnospiraceae bacterium]